MTKEEINRQVAEKVMKFTKHGATSYIDENNGQVWFFDEFNPAERIDHAWMVVEKFISTALYKTEQWSCSLDLDGYKWGQAEANTAPMAICLAALKAKEGENE